jgi:hypothetical protein
VITRSLGGRGGRRIGVNDRREVVVGQHHVRRLLRHVGAGDAHGDARVGGLDGGGVVDAASPVIATTCPRDFHALTIFSLWAAVTRA